MVSNLTMLNKDNFELYAAKAYKNYQCINYDEFRSDLTTIKMIKKGLSTRKRNLRLLVNQLILFFNVFETNAAVEMLLYTVPEHQHTEIKTLMYFLNFVSDRYISDEFDLELIKELESI